MSAHYASDLRYYASLVRGPTEWTGTGTSVTPLLSASGNVVTWRFYDGVHEGFCGEREDAVEASRRRAP